VQIMDEVRRGGVLRAPRHPLGAGRSITVCGPAYDGHRREAAPLAGKGPATPPGVTGRGPVRPGRRRRPVHSPGRRGGTAAVHRRRPATARPTSSGTRTGSRPARTRRTWFSTQPSRRSPSRPGRAGRGGGSAAVCAAAGAAAVVKNATRSAILRIGPAVRVRAKRAILRNDSRFRKV
jgi:hypothetical protein